MTEVVVPAAVLVVAAFVQGVAGFGFGMVAMGLLPLVLPLTVAVPAVAVLGGLSNAAVLAENRGGLRRDAVLPLLAGAFVGVPLGVLFLHEADPRLVERALGIALVLYALHGLLARTAGSGAPPVASRWRDGVGAVAGSLGGVLGGAFNTGGPPVVLYVAWRRYPPAVVKAALQCFFLVSTAYQLALFAASGTLSETALRTAAVGLPSLGVGLFAGIALGRRLDAAAFRRVVLVVLLVLGIRFLAV